MGNMDVSRIEITEFRDFRGNVERYEYLWKGENPKIQISRDLLEDLRFAKPGDNEFSVGPYKLRILEQDFMLNNVVCVRVDYPLWRVIAWWYRASRTLDLIYRRTIITLAVWRLADYNPAWIPSWRDIKLFARKRNH